MKTCMMIAAAVVMTVAGVAAQGAAKTETYGAGVTLKDVVSVADLYATPDKYVGKTIRVDGVATAVCEEMGCWIAVASESNKDLVVRLKVDHDAGIVFPMTAKGRRVSAEGVFQKIGAGDAEAQEAAAEQKTTNDKAAAFGKAYQIKGLGARVY